MAQTITININESHSANDTASGKGSSADYGPRPSDYEGMLSASEALAAPQPDDRLAVADMTYSGSYKGGSMVPSPNDFELDAADSGMTAPAPEPAEDTVKKKMDRNKK